MIRKLTKIFMIQCEVLVSSKPELSWFCCSEIWSCANSLAIFNVILAKSILVRPMMETEYRSSVHPFQSLAIAVIEIRLHTNICSEISGLYGNLDDDYRSQLGPDPNELYLVLPFHRKLFLAFHYCTQLSSRSFCWRECWEKIPCRRERRQSNL